MDKSEFCNNSELRTIELVDEYGRSHLLTLSKADALRALNDLTFATSLLDGVTKGESFVILEDDQIIALDNIADSDFTTSRTSITPTKISRTSTSRTGSSRASTSRTSTSHTSTSRTSTSHARISHKTNSTDYRNNFLHDNIYHSSEEESDHFVHNADEFIPDPKEVDISSSSETNSNVDEFEDEIRPKDTKNTKDGDYYSWSEEASKLLIYLFKQENVTDYTKFRGKKSLKPKFWTHISKLMQEQGYLVSGRKCSLKWSSLLRHYKSIKDHNAISGNNPEKWDFYENLDKILSEKPYIKPVSVASSDDNREKTPEADMTGLKDTKKEKIPNGRVDGNIPSSLTIWDKSSLGELVDGVTIELEH
ncbi:Protein of unknown function [Cotesia congregata]|uniref:Myb/SANT-like DNA-binding domain-containing protein n=1 Tax=Cotesia congregata TaxID=51543 RepID=A0A8J2MR73_COTCN|nr:Protein of unknown function [Cotesia congregata]